MIGKKPRPTRVRERIKFVNCHLFDEPFSSMRSSFIWGVEQDGEAFEHAVLPKFP